MGLSADRNTPELVEPAFKMRPIKGTTTVYKGSLCVSDTSGLAKPGVAATGLVCIGRARKQYDNSAGSDGDIVGEFECGVFKWDQHGTTIDTTNVGEAAYIYDDHTVTLDSTSASPAGFIERVDSDGGVWVNTPDDLAAILDFAATSSTSYSSTPEAVGDAAATAGSSSNWAKGDHVHAPWSWKTLSLDASITGSADTNGTPNTAIDVGTALPTNAWVVAVRITLTTPASGGSVSAADLDIGWSGSTEAVIKDFDLVGSSAGTYNAGASAATFVLPVPASGKQLAAIVTPDGGHKLSALTALAVTIDVAYVVGPA